MFEGRTAVLATMHHKERVIAPILEPALGLRTVVPQKFDADAFGTFSREVKRVGGQREVARHKAIAQATQDLLNKINHRCPNCFTPGFELIERKPGLPCSLCGMPTNLTLAHMYQCQKCNFSEEILHSEDVRSIDPAQCSYCNP